MKNVVEARGVNSLIHFTRAENLTSIFKLGLLPVNFLNKKGIDFKFNDQYRYDDCEDANCLSIQFPNYRMFSKYRFQDSSIDWVVLGIKPEVLWEKDCAFCVENAASSNERSKSLEERKGIEAFNRLYDEYPGKPTRKQLGLPSFYPTHPQAEVLVFGLIEPTYIWGVAFKDELARNKYSSLIPSNIEVEVFEQMFKYRSDYEEWR
ncbi:DUF4433 domain-containing protein [Bacillus cereus]|uniref:DarT ssDNA thymidine ADP-ribosyltransferase family protein n=1 Tax=Bacillus cereus TaxID=1396 RepID=UPI0023E3EBE2|nr:DarT ssDNA thymidine ADP-ribosyltransferase family protein [Bacillus cereus]MDF3555397.1 DUF4433 domain-containing protein [Bacillus cereus]